jgi:hypothetical protein
MITAHLVGDTELIARFAAMPGGLQQGVARAMTRLSLEGQRLSQQKVSGDVLNVRTGVLRSSINAKPTTVTASSVMGGWGTNVSYARPLEMGVPHSWEIRPKSARALAFEIGGRTIFAAYVTHPPMAPHSFMRSALREMTPRIVAELNATVAEVVIH